MRSLALRIRTHWVLKMFGTMLGIYGFFLLYFWVQRSQAARAMVVPMTFVDDWVGISQYAVLPYASLWLYVSLAPALAANMAALRSYITGAVTMAGVGLATYWLFPTRTPAFDVDWSGYPALHLLKATDLGGNAFPSLHVAFAAQAGAVIARELRDVGAPAWVRATNWLWCTAIVYSTLATRQHVAIDVVGGLLLAGVALGVCALREAQLDRSS
jgi:membrane-associated phospholipid phosphatase